MANTTAKDLTVGSPMKLIIRFLIPLLFGMLFQQFYNMVDTMIIGRFLGVDALAGVESTGSVSWLLLGFCMGTCSGFAIPVAQKFGSHDYDGLRRTVGNILWLSAIIAAVMTLGISSLCRNILVWMNNPPETISYAYDYIFIIFLGIPATILYNMLAGIIRSLGDSRTPLLFLIFSSILNVILDLVLILVAKMGVAGAAVATVLSQLVSGILCLVFMVRRFPILRLSRDDLKLRGDECRMLLGMGLPMGLQYSITSIGTILMQTAVNNLGAAAMAAVTASDKLGMLLAIPLDAIGTAAATYVGQNVGAGKLDRIHAGTKANAILGGVYSIFIFVMIFLFGDLALSLFVEPGQTLIIQMGHQFLTIVSSFYILLLLVNLLRFSIQGMGFSNYAMIAGVLEMIARGAMALLLVPKFGFDAVCFANPAAWIMADAFLVPMYFYGMKRLGYKKNKGCARANSVIK